MRPLTHEQMVRRYFQGYGRGELANYRPWLEVKDVPSKGICSRILGQKTNRQHHLLSRGERRVFVDKQWDDSVTDIREQYPLWPIDETIAIAEAAGIRHPKHPETRTPIVMTTDFLLSERDGSMRAISVKQERSLNSDATKRKMYIERMYWQARGIHWTIATEDSTCHILNRNLEWINECWNAPLPPKELSLVQRSLLNSLQERNTFNLKSVCQANDKNLGYQLGTSVLVFRHSLVRKFWQMPMNKPIHAINAIFPSDCLIELPQMQSIPAVRQLAA